MLAAMFDVGCLPTTAYLSCIDEEGWVMRDS